MAVAVLCKSADTQLDSVSALFIFAFHFIKVETINENKKLDCVSGNSAIIIKSKKGSETMSARMMFETRAQRRKRLHPTMEERIERWFFSLLRALVPALKSRK